MNWRRRIDSLVVPPPPSPGERKCFPQERGRRDGRRRLNEGGRPTKSKKGEEKRGASGRDLLPSRSVKATFHLSPTPFYCPIISSPCLPTK